MKNLIKKNPNEAQREEKKSRKLYPKIILYAY